MPEGCRVSRILVVDDERHVRAAIVRSIRRDFDGAFVGEAGDAQAALRMVAEAGWDLVLLDISMPGMSGLEALREMRARKELVPVVIVSSLPSARYEAAALHAGAFAFLQKERLAKELRAIIRDLVSQLRAAGTR